MGINWKHEIKVFKFINSETEEKINQEILEWTKEYKQEDFVILETRSSINGKYLFIIIHYKK